MIRAIVHAFEAHPATVGETYWQHFRAASRFGLLLSRAAGGAFLHALLPFLCERTASDTVIGLCDEMSARRNHPQD